MKFLNNNNKLINYQKFLNLYNKVRSGFMIKISKIKIKATQIKKNLIYL